MGRVTRAKAAEVAEALHIDEDQVLFSGIESSSGSTREMHIAEQQQLDRAPLGELEVNGTRSTSQSENTTELRKSTRGGRKRTETAAKDEKDNLVASAAIQEEQTSTMGHPEVLPDEAHCTPSPASLQAAEDLMKDAPNPANAGAAPVAANIFTEDPGNNNTKSNTRALKVTRSRPTKQLQDTPVEQKRLVDEIEQSRVEQDTMDQQLNGTIGVPQITHAEDLTSSGNGAMPVDAPASPLPNAVPKPLVRLRGDTPAKRSTSNKENVEPRSTDSPFTPQPTQYDSLEQAVVAAATPQAVLTQEHEREDPIAALDNLDEAVENVSRDIPDIKTSPEKAKSKKDAIEKKLVKREAPVVRATKASQARISLCQNPDASTKGPTLGRPRPSTTLGRSSSVRQSEGPGKRIASNSSTDRSPTDGEKKEVIIPHSKPRPMSMTFPAPPQPIKSTKAPTQSTFQLPGEAVAAKLKAAREARMQKEEEKKNTFKARLVPSSLSRAPSVRQTTASKARESIITGRELTTGVSNSSAAKFTPARAQSVATSRPSLPATTKPRTALTGATRPTNLSTSAMNRPSPAAKPRPNTALANTSKPRSSIFSSSTATAAHSANAVAPTGVGRGTVKGKEVFNRPAAAKAAAEKERLEKEAAAKKARADAAERGRQASREWAEKQKKSAAAKKAASAVANDGLVSVVATILEVRAVETSS